MPEVLFLTEGGGLKGWGHLSRCLAITQGLEYYACRWKAVVDAHGELPAFAKTWEVQDWQKLKDPLTDRIKTADYVVIDSYLAGHEVYQRLYGLNPNLLIIDDNQRIEYPPCLLLNPNVYGHQLDYPSTCEVRTGPEYILLRKPFWDIGPRQKTELKSILITLGAGGNFPCQDILEFLGKHFPQLQKHIIVFAQGVPLDRARLDERTYYYKDLDAAQMCRLMEGCEVSISAGGQTLAELARTGTVPLIFAIAENQKRNAQAWGSMDFGEMIDVTDIKQACEAVQECLEAFKDKELLYKKASIGRAVVDGQGVKRIAAELLFRNDLSLRMATKEDSRDLWSWRNAPSLRRYSLSREDIPWERHEEWFLKKRSDPNVDIYIAEDKNKNKIGQVRFEIDDRKVADIHVNLNPDFIGKGVGAYMIMLATRVLSKKRQGQVDNVRALVLKDNVASQKAFTKAGYYFDHQTFKEEQLVYVYMGKLNGKRFF